MRQELKCIICENVFFISEKRFPRSHHYRGVHSLTCCSRCSKIYGRISCRLNNQFRNRILAYKHGILKIVQKWLSEEKDWDRLKKKVMRYSIGKKRKV